ncbi:2-dehydro-3-deoxygalactonokinase [Fluviibacterium sp. DFM31]|uniref:2-dehydro-3-deoxygalactonokinase n=1 Tax=Meridianimarinicoccus marinus TaxID=3231483 RepID=A0ABV3LB01_9RHOB
MIRYVGVDWGTSSFRLWVIDADGQVLSERKGSEGMSTLTATQFGPVLEAHLAALDVGTDVPVVICGMAGARTGWREARYLDLPLPLDRLAESAIRVPHDSRDIRILPGVAQRAASAPDVMRGEETMLLGAVRQFGVDGTVCMPGTHSKWAVIEKGVLARFETAMTGEIFALLSRQSTLSHFVDAAKFDGEAFDGGVRAALTHPESLLRDLFHLRAGPLLDLMEGAEVASRLSGLLIGLEIAGAQAKAGDSVTLIASGVLADRYMRALDGTGCLVRRLDADDAVCAGLSASAAALWPTP